VLDRLTVDDFAPRVGETFSIDAGEAGTIELELTSARTQDPKADAVGDDGVRSPFTLLFRGPAEPVLAQQICPLENETLGRLDIFLVPLGQTPGGVDYEAVFS
jgi:hypothetical protein